MRRAAVMASVAGIGAVGGLLAPLALVTPAPPAAAVVTGTLSPRTPSALPTVLPAVTAVQPRLAFTGVSSATTPDGAVDLWDVVAEDGSDSRVLAETSSTGSSGYSGPSYAPDGSRAVVVSDLGEAGRRLMVVPVAPGEDVPGATEPLPSDWTSGTLDDEPDWSAAGEVVFTREVSDAAGEFLGVRLRVVDAETGEVTDPFAQAGVDYEERVDALPAGDPAWSPDGSRILFVAGADEAGAGTLWVLDRAAAALYPVTTANGEPAVGQGPVWSPDGDELRIGYVDHDLGGAPLVTGTVGDVVGTGADAVLPVTEEVLYQPPVDEILLPGLHDLRDPAWSPDGEEVAVRATDLRGEALIDGIYAVSTADGSYRSVTDTGTGAWQEIEGPVYQPWSDLAVTLTAPATAAVGVDTDLTVTVSNAGPSPAWGEVEIDLPGGEQGLDLAVELPDGCVADGGMLSCALPGPLPAGEEVVLIVTVALEQAGRYTTAARVTSLGPDPLTIDNLATAALDVPHPPALGTEPRLAFSYGYDDARGFQAEVADVRAADGSDFRLLVAEQIEDDDGGVHWPDERQASYSPDGRRVVLSGHHTLEGGGGEWGFPWQSSLLVADVGPGPDGATNVRPLTAPGDPGFTDTDPVWSPDGTRIAFRRSLGDSSPFLAVADPESGDGGRAGPGGGWVGGSGCGRRGGERVGAGVGCGGPDGRCAVGHAGTAAASRPQAWCAGAAPSGPGRRPGGRASQAG